MKKPDQEIAYFLSRLDGFEFFLRRSDSHWREDLEEYKKSLEDASLHISKFEGRRDLYASLETEFPEYQRRANLMTLIALFEDFLNQLCLSVQEYTNILTSFATYEGNGVDKAKNYLKKVASINFPSQLTAWKKIKGACKIRNVIAHTAGHIHPIIHGKQIRIVATEQQLKSEEYARIHLKIKNEFVVEVLGNIREFSCELYKQINAMDRNKQKH